MDKQRLKAYLELIQALLRCPNGEEWILLRQHEDLVNPELVQVMEQVAAHLASEGQVKEAKYLHNWAGQLHHVLTQAIAPPPSEDKTQAYLQLIQQLLQCPEGQEQEILAAHEDLIGPGLVRTMLQVAKQAMAEGETDSAEFLNNLATALNRAWLEAHQFGAGLSRPEQQPPAASIEQPVASPPPLQTSSIWDEPEEQSPPVPSLESPPPSPPEARRPSPPAEVTANEPIAEQLATIAQALVKLDVLLSSRLKAADPLWYMERLEQAYAAHWLLTTEEVERLIGVKPVCHKQETTFQRGSWLFVKAGKVGTQTSWRVEKIPPNREDSTANET
jgi:hypothetical protein